MTCRDRFLTTKYGPEIIHSDSGPPGDADSDLG